MSPTFSHLSKIGSIVGCLALFTALVVANRTPASGYELSIYQSTPTLVWIGLGIALAVAVLVGLTAPRDTRTHDSALLLGGSAALAIVALPILRGYTFLGGGDSLSHVGWAREIQRRNPPSGPVALSRDPHGDGGRGGDGRDLATRIEPLRGVACVPARLPALRAACRPTNRPHPAGVRGRTLRGHAVRSRQQHRRPLQRTCREPRDPLLGVPLLPRAALRLPRIGEKRVGAGDNSIVDPPSPRGVWHRNLTRRRIDHTPVHPPTTGA